MKEQANQWCDDNPDKCASSHWAGIEGHGNHPAGTAEGGRNGVEQIPRMTEPEIVLRGGEEEARPAFAHYGAIAWDRATGKFRSQDKIQRALGQMCAPRHRPEHFSATKADSGFTGLVKPLWRKPTAGGSRIRTLGPFRVDWGISDFSRLTDRCSPRYAHPDDHQCNVSGHDWTQD